MLDIFLFVSYLWRNLNFCHNISDGYQSCHDLSSSNHLVLRGYFFSSQGFEYHSDLGFDRLLEVPIYCMVS